jgi:DNA primase
MRIPEDIIEQVRSASDIVDVIGASVRLRKRGKSHLGLCPFHTEKTPSFTVSREKQMYHCFGCGQGGNVFTFVMAVEKVSFVEAVRALADRAGIAIPTGDARSDAEATETEALYDACRRAAAFYADNLTQGEGKLAAEYFRFRGFSDETMRKFGLGYSPAGWDGLLRHLSREGIPPEIMDRAGLVIRREDGTGYYDRFRGRAMFPTFSPSGRIVGFGARKLKEEDPLGKYINSPESPIFNKGRTLYGLYQAREAIRDKETALLVEGYADLITVFQAGIHHVVASSGTALTPDQIALLSRHARSVVITYDADSAGSAAALRGVDIILEQGLEVRVARLPAGEDPDSFIRTHGAEAFTELVEGAVSFLEFKADALAAEGSLADPERQARAIRSLVESVARIPDELRRSLHVKHLAEKYGIYASVLHKELERHLHGRGQSRREDVPSSQPAPESRGTAPSAAPAPPVEIPAPQRDLLRLILEEGIPMAEYVFAAFPPQEFVEGRARRLAALLGVRTSDDRPWTPAALLDEITDEELRRFVADLSVSPVELSPGWVQFGVTPEGDDLWSRADRCLALLRRQEVERLIAENETAMKAAQVRKEPLQPYLEHHQALTREKQEITAAITGASRTRPPGTQ